jgi:hypothetical protein
MSPWDKWEESRWGEWEEFVRGENGFGLISTLRMKVPNGWIVKDVVYLNGHAPSVSLCFVPGGHKKTEMDDTNIGFINSHKEYGIK